MTDFLLDEFGDLKVDGGMELVTDYALEAKQRLAQGLEINYGEWFADITAGLPYIENPNEDLPTNIRYFLGDKFPDSAAFITNTYDDYIKSLPFILKLESSYTFDRQTRVYRYIPIATLKDGEVITFPALSSQL